MSAKCGVCQADSNLNLCNRHIKYLDQCLGEVPWLLGQLDVTVTKQDRLHQVQGRSEQSTRSVYNVGASMLASEVATLLSSWTAKLVNENKLTLAPKRPQSRAMWLRHHVTTLASREDAKDAYFDVVNLTGEPDKPGVPGRLVAAINKRTRVFAGPCPAEVGFSSSGEPIKCSTPLYSYDSSTEAKCPKCKKVVDAQENRKEALRSRDLLPEKALLAALDDLGEHVPRTRLYEWLTKDKVQIFGYLHDGVVRPKKVHNSDPRVMSLTQVRHLRWQHETQVAS